MNPTASILISHDDLKAWAERVFVRARLPSADAADAAEDLEGWGRRHRERIEATLKEKGCGILD